MRFVARSVTEYCVLRFKVHLDFLFPWNCPASVIGRCGRRVTERSRVFSKFCVAVKRSVINTCLRLPIDLK
jgi:hypothetical protein